MRACPCSRHIPTCTHARACIGMCVHLTAPLSPWPAMTPRVYILCFLCECVCVLLFIISLLASRECFDVYSPDSAEHMHAYRVCASRCIPLFLQLPCLMLCSRFSRCMQTDTGILFLSFTRSLSLLQTILRIICLAPAPPADHKHTCMQARHIIAFMHAIRQWPPPRLFSVYGGDINSCSSAACLPLVLRERDSRAHTCASPFSSERKTRDEREEREEGRRKRDEREKQET